MDHVKIRNVDITFYLISTLVFDTVTLNVHNCYYSGPHNLTDVSMQSYKRLTSFMYDCGKYTTGF